MSNVLPPSPVDAPFGSYNWADWYEKIRRLINQVTIIAWSQIADFTGSNLNQLATRLHNSLQSIQGGNGTTEFYHLTNADFTTFSGVTLPLSVARGGNGTATPALVAGTNITITGTWPALTINSTAAGGLTNWTEAVNTAAPNATVPVVSFLPNNAATNVDGVLGSKGTGAIAAKISDNGVANGNKRGANAVDWQQVLSGSATSVASGSQSVLAGGGGNTSSGTNSVVGGGSNNIASNTQATIAGGNSNTASFTKSTVGGGGSNIASANNATVAGGTGNTASAQSASIPGGDTNLADAVGSVASGIRATVRGFVGAQARASDRRSTNGDNQARDNILRGQTSGIAAVVLTSDGGAASATNQYILPGGSGLKVRAQIIARNTTTGDLGWWDISGACKNVGGTVTLSGTSTITAFNGDAGMATVVGPAIVADNVNKCLQITGAGIAATTINWTVEVTSVELTS